MGNAVGAGDKHTLQKRDQDEACGLVGGTLGKRGQVLDMNSVVMATCGTTTLTGNKLG